MKIATHIRRFGVGTCAGKVICTLAAVLLLVSFSLAGQKAQPSSKTKPTGSFDRQIKKVTINFGSPADPTNQHMLVCHYYPHLLVKEYAPYGIGTDWLSILRSPGKLPACKRSHEPGARIIKYPEWDGLFRGVKGHLVFFDASEPFNGGCAFVVYDSVTGRRLFEDTSHCENDWSSVRVYSTKAGYLLKYLRVVDLDCDVNAAGTPCWKKVETKYALKTKPVCTGYDYKYLRNFYGGDKFPSRVAYPVEVSLSAHPTIRAVAGPAKCWPQQ